MEEIELSEQCRLGNNQARKELYEQYAGRMLGICLRYTGDRDTAQDRFHDGLKRYSILSTSSPGEVKAPYELGWSG